ncbi:MAG: DNA mismatch repair endonuclease MutL [Gammaproteobacteria bacterium]|nr:DNA mismatch repair endonuclease MutL [Gammaproteobacteria bacterium]
MSIPRISELPATLASQIAAGEVIERPAAVVKELLDNSIDAGADNVTVAVVDGGHKLISVSDNGHGIHPEDIELALRRHSTSKINAQSDLDCITSLGFRGEALASIAAVSGFLLVSRTEQSDSAWSLSFDPVSGNSDIRPAARARGTTVEAADIFQATPARRKFMRSRTTEYLHITEIFKRVACSRFNVTFTLAHNDKTQLRYRACADNMIERVEDVFGRRFAAESLPVNYESGGMRLWGWLGGSSLSRSQSDRQFCFVNGRVVRDKKILHAVRAAFDDSLPTGRYPTCLLHLDIDPSITDINVHPTKSEIRFRDNRGVHDFINMSLRDALKTAHSLDLSDAGVMSEAGRQEYPQRQVYSYGQQVREAGLFYQNLVSAEQQDDLLDKAAGLGVPRLALSPEVVLAQRNEDLILLNYRAIRAYVLDFRLRQEYMNERVRRRPLLVPVHMEAGNLQVDLAGQYAELLDTIGLSLRVVSANTISIREIPVLLEEADIRTLVSAVLEALREAGDGMASEQRLLTIMAGSMGKLMESPSNSMVQDVLNGLDRTGLDTAQKHHKGLWRTLSPGELSRLIDE